MRLGSILPVVSLAVASPVMAQATIGGDWRADVAGFAQQLVAAGLVPGVGVAVAVGDWVVYEEGFGLADLDARRPVTEATQFYIASTTKALTGTAAMLAAHRGELGLDRPMTAYLPGARLAEGVPRDQITVRDLGGLTHGLSGDGPVVLRTAYTGEFTSPLLLDLLRHHQAAGAHGTFDYNNLGFNLLGLVLEAVFGEDWKDVVDRLVLAPLGMRSTTAWRSRADPERLAAPHDFGPDGFRAVPLAKYDNNLHAAGGHFATAGDLARFVAAHQSDGTLEGVPVLPAEALRSTQRQHAAQDRRFGPYHRHGWGFGWDLGTYQGDTLLHRFGGFQGFRSHMSFMPARRLGVVVLVNGDGPASPASDLLATYIYDRLLARPDLETRARAQLDTLVAAAAQARREIAAHLAERARRLAPLRHPLTAYAGSYESPVMGRAVWRVVAGGLEMRIGVLQSRAEVYDAGRDQLRVELAGGGSVVTFEFPEGDGPARAMILSGIRFERVRPM